MAAAKAAVDAGELGRLTTVRSTTMDPEPPSREYIAGSGGLYRDCGVHDKAMEVRTGAVSILSSIPRLARNSNAIQHVVFAFLEDRAVNDPDQKIRESAREAIAGGKRSVRGP